MSLTAVACKPTHNINATDERYQLARPEARASQVRKTQVRKRRSPHLDRIEEGTRYSSQRAVTSSRETVTEEPVQSTASIVWSLTRNRKLSEGTVARPGKRSRDSNSTSPYLGKLRLVHNMWSTKCVSMSKKTRCADLHGNMGDRA